MRRMVMSMKPSEKVKVERKADELRKIASRNGYGLNDIFRVLRAIDVIFIRYPFVDEKPLGFCTRQRGKNIIVSNSSMILSRELFTIAHELGHVIFDFNDEDVMIVDIEELSDSEKSFMERRAYYFAETLLMPKEGLERYIRLELETVPGNLDALDIVRIQQEFKVSYSAVVWRLLKAGIIKKNHKDDLLRQQHNTTSHVLFDILGFTDELLKPFNKIKVPEKYIDFITSNYKDDIIPESSFDKAMKMVGLSDEQIQSYKALSKEEENS